MTQSKRSLFLRGARDGLPICFGYLSVAFAYGIHSIEGGLPVWAALTASLTNFTSAGQVAGTDLILAGATLFEIAVTLFLINLRYALMSLSLSQKLDPGMSVLERAALAFGNTDEVFAVAMRRPGVLTTPYLAGLIFTPYVGWCLGTLFGATAAGLMPAVVRSALGLAIYGMFLAIILPEARANRAVALVALVSAAVSCLFACLPLLRRLSAGWVIIIASVAASSLGAFLFPIRETSDEPDEAPQRGAAQ